MILLRSFDTATQYIDCESGNELNIFTNPQICGWYKFNEGRILALIVIEKQLYFLYDKEKILITPYHKVLIQRINKTEGVFSLINGDNEIISYKYIYPKRLLYPDTSPFEYLDENDFIWEHYVENILNNDENKRNFIANLE